MSVELATQQVDLFAEQYRALDKAGMQEAASRLMRVDFLSILEQLAGLVKVGDERGWTSELGFSTAWVRMGRDIGCGLVNAAAVVRFGGTRLESQLQKLSPQRQLLLAQGGGVEVYSWDDGQMQKREVPPEKLTSFEHRQVFGPDGIRDAAEQRSWLESQKKKGMMRTAKGDFALDLERRELIVKVGDREVRISQKVLYEYLRKLGLP